MPFLPVEGRSELIRTVKLRSYIQIENIFTKEWLPSVKIELLLCTKTRYIFTKEWLPSVKIELLLCTKTKYIFTKEWLPSVKIELLLCTKQWLQLI